MSLTFTCDAPLCKSHHTMHPADAKDPVRALERFGWEVAGSHGDGKQAVVDVCYCPVHRGYVPPADDGEKDAVPA